MKYGDINNFCPIDGSMCRRCYLCAVLEKTAPWPGNWLSKIAGNWPGDETIGELLTALKNKGIPTPPIRGKVKCNKCGHKYESAEYDFCPYCDDNLGKW